MKIDKLPCTTCAHKEMCMYKERLTEFSVSNYPIVPLCSLYANEE